MFRKIILDDLIEDVEKTKNLLSEDRSQFNRRNYVRALFSLFEASLANLREDVGIMLNQKMNKQAEFNLYQFLPILDEDVQLSSNGKINLVPNKYPLKNLVAYIFKKYAELDGKDFNPLSNHKWESFQKAVQIRNRITHPTEYEDAIISEEELEKIFEAEEWWKESVIKLSKNA